MIEQRFWHNKRVFVTGHTGFKGSWLSLWLLALGAEVTGYALQPPTTPSLFQLCGLDNKVRSIIADVRDADLLRRELQIAEPEIVFHLAAQPLVRESYKNPLDTYMTNVIGAVNLFEAVRSCDTVRCVINITTDKCYENREWVWGYRESDMLGGYDPYSSSKACAELVTSAYRNSYFNPLHYASHGVSIATARAGNVIGGGDWAADRLIPDCLRALEKGQAVQIRNPKAVRPWQHVLESLSGYMLLAQKLYEQGSKYGEGWNFGPPDQDAKSVEWIVKRLCEKWGKGASFSVDAGPHPHEAYYLKLDCSKAAAILQWSPRWHIERAIDKVIEWHHAYMNSKPVEDICFKQIREYMNVR